MPFDGDARGHDAVLEDLAVLRLARAEVARAGMWLQGSYGSPRGPRCAVGWIGHVARRLGVGGDRQELADRLLMPVAYPGCLIMLHTECWNDAPGRTQAEVVARFDFAIARLEGRADAV